MQPPLEEDRRNVKIVSCWVKIRLHCKVLNPVMFSCARVLTLKKVARCVVGATMRFREAHE